MILKEEIQKRFEVTQKQIGRLEKSIAEASKPEVKDNLNPKIYKLMIEGYKSVRVQLQGEAKNYRKQLGL